MSFRTTAALLAVLIILAGAVYYVTLQPATDPTAASAKRSPVVTFTPTDATKIVVSSADKTTEVTKSGSTWTITKPDSGPAEVAQVEGWADQIGTLTSDRVIDGASDLSAYGLASPKFNVQVDLKTGTSIKLAFGDKTPDGADYYVRLPDDATKAKSVFLIGSALGDDLSGALTKPPKALPTPTPLPTLVPVTVSPLPTTVAGTPTVAAGG